MVERALAAFAALETIHVFGVFLPPPAFVANVDPATVRQGEAMAAAYALGAGAILSVIIGGWLPLALAGAAVALAVVAYESALRGS